MADDSICVRQTPYVAATLHPPADDRGVIQAGVFGKGAAAHNATLRPVAREPETAGAGGKGCGAVENQAKAALKGLAEAEQILGELELAKAPEAKIGEAKHRVTIAQRAAERATAQNVKEQQTLRAQRLAARQLADDKLTASERDTRVNADPSTPAKLAAAAEEFSRASHDFSESNTGVIRAELMQEAARGPGAAATRGPDATTNRQRAELEATDNFNTFEASPGIPDKSRLSAATERYPSLVRAQDAFDHAVDQFHSVVNRKGSPDIVQRHLHAVQTAAEKLRVAWALARADASNGSDRELQKACDWGLHLANQNVRGVTEPDWVRVMQSR
jgi:hypothetical protein